MRLLENDCIRLRALEPEDLELLYAWENDTTFWIQGSALSPYSHHTLKEHIATSHRDIYEAKQLRLMIEWKELNTAIGVIDLYDFDPHQRRAAVGLLVDLHWQRKSVATMSLNLIKHYAFTFLRLHQLYAYALINNYPSKALLLRCGFDTSSLLREWIYTENGFSDVLLAQCMNKERME